MEIVVENLPYPNLNFLNSTKMETQKIMYDRELNEILLKALQNKTLTPDNISLLRKNLKRIIRDRSVALNIMSSMLTRKFFKGVQATETRVYSAFQLLNHVWDAMPENLSQLFETEDKRARGLLPKSHKKKSNFYADNERELREIATSEMYQEERTSNVLSNRQLYGQVSKYYGIEAYGYFKPLVSIDLGDTVLFYSSQPGSTFNKKAVLFLSRRIKRPSRLGNKVLRALIKQVEKTRAIHLINEKKSARKITIQENEVTEPMMYQWLLNLPTIPKSEEDIHKAREEAHETLQRMYKRRIPQDRHIHYLKLVSEPRYLANEEIDWAECRIDDVPGTKLVTIDHSLDDDIFSFLKEQSRTTPEKIDIGASMGKNIDISRTLIDFGGNYLLIHIAPILNYVLDEYASEYNHWFRKESDDTTEVERFFSVKKNVREWGYVKTNLERLLNFDLREMLSIPQPPPDIGKVLRT